MSDHSSDQPSISTLSRRRRDVSEVSSQTEHGRLIAEDNSIKGAIGELYEDGTYILKPDGSGETVNLDNNNGGVNSMFGNADNPNYSLIKQFRLSGVINPDGKFLLQAGNAGNRKFQPSTLDLRGLQKSESVPWLTEDDTHVTSVIFDKDYSLSDVPWISEMFDGATNLKLSNEQVTQLLKNFRPSGTEATLWRNVGVERLDLSTFDNSRLDLSKDEARRDSKAVFKDLIGLKEIVFGDKFDFNNYGRKNTPEAFMDTDLSSVERVNILASKEHNDKFIKDWAAEVKTVKNRTDLGTLSLLKDGVVIKSIDDVLSATDSTYEAGMYTIDYVVKKSIYQADESKEYGYMSFHKPVDGPEVVILGTKPTTEVTYQDFKTRYVADPDRNEGEKFTETEGVRGTTMITTTYSVNTDTGVVTSIKGEPKVVAPTDKVVKVGTKSVPIEIDTPIEVVYKADRTIEKGQEVIESQGRLGVKVVTTPKILNINDGTVSDGTPVIEETVMEPKVVKVGAKDKVVTEVIEPAVTYTGDKTKVVGSENVTELGTKGSKVTTTTHEVNPKTGEVIPTVHEPVITPATETTVKVAAKDKVVYSKEGNKVVKTTTTYTVDPTNGNITETSAKETISEDGAKDKIVTEELASPVRYEKDDTRTRGEEDVRTEGKTGTKVTTTTYEVNPKTGEVIPTVHEPVITPATETVVKVAAKDKVVFSKEGNKVVKTTTTYTVDPTNGNVSETSAKETISEDGAKDKIVTEVVEPKVVYEKDDSREVGSENIEISGKPGKKIVTFTHTVDEMTGKVIVAKSEKIVENATDTIVKVASKDKFEIVEKDGKAFERHTVYAVDSKTGEISSSFNDKEVVDKSSDFKKLPNTGLENASGLGAAAAFGLAAMVAIRRRLNQ